MLERFSDDALRLVAAARKRAIELGHDSIGVDHLLLAVLDSPVGPIFAHAGLRPEALVDRESAPEPGVERPLRFAEEAKRVLEGSLREALRLRSHTIAAGHIGLALLGQPAVLGLLDRLGVDHLQLPLRVKDFLRTGADLGGATTTQVSASASTSFSIGAPRFEAGDRPTTCPGCGGVLAGNVRTRTIRTPAPGGGRGWHMASESYCGACGEVL